jgi:haloalkane dehalogenase
VPDALYPFASRHVVIAGCRVHYIDEGTGPTLLFLHGNPTWSFLYRNIVLALRDRFRCIALDYPGFGLSRARDGYDFKPVSHAQIVEGFLQALEVRDVTLMAQDWGRPIGLGVAGRHPERFRALIVGNTWAWPVTGDKHFEYFSRLMGGPIGGLLIHHFNFFVNRLLPAGTRRQLSPDVMAAYRKPFASKASRAATHIFPREIIGSREYLATVRDGLAHLAHLPVLITWGERDPAFRAHERRAFEERFPRHRTVLLPRAGHFIQEDAPDDIVAAIRAWWPDAAQIH